MTAPLAGDDKVVRLRGSAKAKAEPQPKPNGEDAHRQTKGRLDLPVVRMVAGSLPAAVAQANRLLAKHSQTSFIYGEVLVTLEDVDGRLATVPATVVRVRLELARVARWLWHERNSDTLVGKRAASTGGQWDAKVQSTVGHAMARRYGHAGGRPGWGAQPGGGIDPGRGRGDRGRRLCLRLPGAAAVKPVP